MRDMASSLANLDLNAVPALDGELVITTSSGENRITISPKTSFKVILDGRDGDPNETDLMQDWRRQAEGEIDNPGALPAAQIRLGKDVYHKNAARWPDAAQRGTLWLKFAAEHGKTADAQLALGEAYLSGIGVRKDSRIATQGFELFRMALAQGDPKGLAENNIGFCYLYGMGVQKDHALARKHLQSAAQKGADQAMLNLGFLFMEKSSPEYNAEEGIKAFEAAVEAGNVEALYQLGLSYQLGEGVTRNRAKAIEYYQRAKDLGHAKASQTLESM